jgi:hypothetical protein
MTYACCQHDFVMLLQLQLIYDRQSVGQSVLVPSLAAPDLCLRVFSCLVAVLAWTKLSSETRAFMWVYFLIRAYLSVMALISYWLAFVSS